MTDAQPPVPASPQVEVVVGDDLVSGVYANGLAIWSSQHDFTFDFISIQPPQAFVGADGQAQARQVAHVVARVKAAPGILYSILQAITTQMSAYEAENGPIPGGQGPPDAPPRP